ncbi:hypothetical protein HBI47_198410 [Parastagonospora nodorum]|nr:hypothetical protein HBI47_198410 [Parastagonospora nodorum]
MFRIDWLEVGQDQSGLLGVRKCVKIEPQESIRSSESVRLSMSNTASSHPLPNAKHEAHVHLRTRCARPRCDCISSRGASVRQWYWPLRPWHLQDGQQPTRQDNLLPNQGDWQRKDSRARLG